MLDQLKKIDSALLLKINSLHGEWLDQFMYFVSAIWIFTPLFMYVFYLLYKHMSIKSLLLALFTLILVIALCDQISHRTKESVKRYRPTHNLEIGPLVHTVNNYKGGTYGFFSGHASTTFGIAVFLSLLLKMASSRLKIILIAWAFLTAYSRMYLGVHYPSDITIGIVSGTVIGYGMYLLYTYFNTNYFLKD